MKINESSPLIITDDNILYINTKERQKFISKVYTTVSAQILYTIFFISLAYNVKPINDFMIGIYGTGLLFLCFNMLLILSCSLFVCIEKIKQKPYNYIYASSFTIFMSYFLFYMCYSIQPRILLESGLSTLFMFSGLSIYSWQSTIDYSTKGNYLLLSLLTLLLLGVFNIFFNYTFIETIYPVLGVFLFSFYIIYDTQLIFGRQTIKYKPEDYLIASINLYLDIINLFIYLLELINGR
tara:strand:- start:1293 stop:2006 length:714 start_codon:yes stop_codon:yes gene_type:complete